MRSDSEHSIEELSVDERRPIEGASYFRNNGNKGTNDKNKIKILDIYKPIDHN